MPVLRRRCAAAAGGPAAEPGRRPAWGAGRCPGWWNERKPNTISGRRKTSVLSRMESPRGGCAQGPVPAIRCPENPPGQGPGARKRPVSRAHRPDRRPACLRPALVAPMTWRGRPIRCPETTAGRGRTRDLRRQHRARALTGPEDCPRESGDGSAVAGHFRGGMPQHADLGPAPTRYNRLPSRGPLRIE